MTDVFAAEGSQFPTSIDWDELQDGLERIRNCAEKVRALRRKLPRAFLHSPLLEPDQYYWEKRDTNILFVGKNLAEKIRAEKRLLEVLPEVKFSC